MIGEVRTYTIKDGMLDSYLQLFNRQIVPNHAKYGIPIVGAWVDREKNEVTWIRTFASREDRKAKLDVYENTPDRDAVFPVAAYHMAKAEVKILEKVLDPSPQPDASYFATEVAIKAKAEFDAIPKGEAAAIKARTAAPR